MQFLQVILSSGLRMTDMTMGLKFSPLPSNPCLNGSHTGSSVDRLRATTRCKARQMLPNNGSARTRDKLRSWNSQNRKHNKSYQVE